MVISSWVELLIDLAGNGETVGGTNTNLRVFRLLRVGRLVRVVRVVRVVKFFRSLRSFGAPDSLISLPFSGVSSRTEGYIRAQDVGTVPSGYAEGADKQEAEACRGLFRHI